jgi:hypothetical protein
MPYVFVGRCEKRRLAQFKDNLKINFIYDVQTKRKGVRSPGVLYNLNSGKRICELRRGGKKIF